MKLFNRFLTLFLIISVCSLVGCAIGGGDDDDSNYYPSTTLNPAPIAVPAAKVLAATAPVASPTVQVQQAVNESLKTLVSGFRTSVQPSLRASAVPAGVPGLGSNEAINLNFLMSNLLAALPVGGNVNEGLLIDSTNSNDWDYSVATYTASAKTLEVAYVQTYISDYTTYPPVSHKYLSETFKITGCDATVTSGVLGQMTINAGSTLEMKSYARPVSTGADSVLQDSIKITIASGVKVESVLTKTSVNNFVVKNTWDTTSYGVLQNTIGTETVKITFTSPAKFDVVFNEGTRNVTGSISFSDISGSFENISGYAIGVWAEKIGSADPVPMQNASAYKSSLGAVTQTNALVFAGNRMQFGFSANWIDERISIENGLIVMNNISKKVATTTGGTDANYAFSGGTGSMLVKYSGTQPEKYGYIYSLKIDISNMSFDPANKDAAGEGTLINIVKTNSDNSINNLAYKIVAGKPVLQPGESKFEGGSETITVDSTTGNTSVQGTVVVANSVNAPVEEKLEIAYTSTKDSVGEIKVKASLRLAGRNRTVFFTRKTSKVIDNGHVYDGEKAEDTATGTGTDTGPEAIFTVDSTGAGSIIVGSNSPESFKVDL